MLIWGSAAAETSNVSQALVQACAYRLYEQ